MGHGLCWELRRARQGRRVEAGMRELRGRKAVTQVTQLPWPAGPRLGVGWRGASRDCPSVPNSSLVLRASPRQGVWVFKASAYL